ncbi:putative ankyrin repeat-containing protein [Planoprotostelium fungivorum]|uniref:Putative ankyrin repeat-containing protein n=1 Tax=Planoprotostelium fungivorum TaxID=1890364 RepID=A0A2P6NF75_9EUKA|nr:putative ankyrin repeat-containing protein [Planoprotostelium fungivorum]
MTSENGKPLSTTMAADLLLHEEDKLRCPWFNVEEWNEVHRRVERFLQHAEGVEKIEPEDLSADLGHISEKIKQWKARGRVSGSIESTFGLLTAVHSHTSETADSEGIILMGSMALLRLVTSVSDLWQRQGEEVISIAQIAEHIDFPRSIVEVRNQISHHQLPKLKKLIPMCMEGLRWIKSYYWDKQFRFYNRSTVPLQESINQYISDMTARFSKKPKEHIQPKERAIICSDITTFLNGLQDVHDILSDVILKKSIETMLEWKGKKIKEWKIWTVLADEINKSHEGFFLTCARKWVHHAYAIHIGHEIYIDETRDRVMELMGSLSVDCIQHRYNYVQVAYGPIQRHLTGVEVLNLRDIALMCLRMQGCSWVMQMMQLIQSDIIILFPHLTTSVNLALHSEPTNKRKRIQEETDTSSRWSLTNGWIGTPMGLHRGGSAPNPAQFTLPIELDELKGPKRVEERETKKEKGGEKKEKGEKETMEKVEAVPMRVHTSNVQDLRGYYPEDQGSRKEENRDHLSPQKKGGLMTDGIITSHDLTRAILHAVLNERVGSQIQLHWKRRRFCPESHSSRREQFAILRSTCKLWKDIVDGFTDWLADYDLFLAVRGCKIDSLRFLLTRTELDPSIQDDAHLRMASRDGSTEIVRLLLSDPRVDPSAWNNKAIVEAAAGGHIEIVRLLLFDPRVDPSARNNKAVVKAATKGHAEVVRLLLSNPRVDPSAENNEAISKVVEKGNTRVVRLLLTDDRVDPSVQDNQAIQIAPESGTSELISLLLAHPKVDPSAGNNKAIRLSIMNTRNPQVVELLLADPRVDPSASNNQAIRYACHYGRFEIFLALSSDPRVDPSANDNEAIRNASQYGHVEICRALLADPRVNPAALDNEAIQYAAMRGLTQIVKLLLSRSIDPSPRNYGAVTEASREGHGKMVKPSEGVERASDHWTIRTAAHSGPSVVADKYLGTYRVDPTAQDNWAVRMASQNGHHEVVELLLADPGVDPSAMDNQPIREAASRGHHQVVRLLLSHPAVNPAVRDNFPLRIACENYRTETVRLLLADDRVDPSVYHNCLVTNLKEEHEIVDLLLAHPRVDPSEKCQEAIKLASDRGHAKIVRSLLADHRVDPSTDDNYPIRAAAKRGYAEVVELLLSHPLVDASAQDGAALREATERGHTRVSQLLSEHEQKRSAKRKR